MKAPAPSTDQDLSLLLLVDDRWSSFASLVELHPVPVEKFGELALVLPRFAPFFRPSSISPKM